jgi:hypothetical protein
LIQELPPGDRDLRLVGFELTPPRHSRCSLRHDDRCRWLRVAPTRGSTGRDVGRRSAPAELERAIGHNLHT